MPCIAHKFTQFAQGRLLRPAMTNEMPRLALERGLLMLALEPTDMLLGVKLKPDPPDQVKLGFEEVDVMLLVLHQAFEQIARDVVLDAVAVGRRFLVKATGADLGGKIAFDDFLDILADPQGI